MSNNPFGVRNDSPMTNNPFATNSAASRFPAVDGGFSPPEQRHGSSPNGGYQSPQQTGFFTQTQQPFEPPSQPVFPPYGQSAGPSSFVSQPSGFQPQSPFGQLTTDAPGASNIRYGGGGLTQSTGPPMQTSSPSYANVADLDPYSLAQLPWAQPTRPPDAVQQTPQSPATASSGGVSWNDDHPRSFVQSHKNELESWRPEAWRRFRESVEKLKQAWIGRKDLVNRAMQGYGMQWDPVDAQRVHDLLQEADNNIDQITASSLQFQEVESGYRHSRDAPSRTRVREALNAGLSSLPEWPEPLQTSRGVMMGYDTQPPLQIATPPQPPQFQQQPQFVQQSPYQQQPPFQQPRQEPLFTGWNGGAGVQPPYPQQQQQPYSGYGRQW